MERKITYRVFTLLIILGMLPAAFAGEKETKSKITNATIFTEGAQVFRTAKTTLSAGKTTLAFTGLSAYIDKQTIRVTGYGDLTILSVNHRTNYLEKPRDEQKIADMKQRIKILNQKVKEESTWIDVLKERENFLKSNVQITGKNEAIQPEAFKTMDAYFGDKMESIRFSIMEKGRLIDGYRDEISTLQKQIKETDVTDLKSIGEIVVEVEASHQTTAEFEINYMVASAGWYPSYDIRVTGISQPVMLDYKANVFQNTGVEWEQVNLKFSNILPDQKASAPELYPWYLDQYNSYTSGSSGNRKPRISNKYAGYTTDPTIREVHGIVKDDDTGEAIPFASIVVTGTSVATTSDFDGKFSVSIPQNAKSLRVSFVGYHTEEVPIYSRNIEVLLSASAETLEAVEVVDYKDPLISYDKQRKQKAKSVESDIIRQETFFEYGIQTPYTLKSTSKPTQINMQTVEMPAIYRYMAVPKLDPKAYLTARIAQWEDYNLISGEANLYFEHTFVGKSLLDVAQLSDTLEISLGEDKNIFIERKKVKEFYKYQNIGSNVVETFVWKITARNTKDVDIDILIRDQVPVSENRDISVDVKEISGGKLNEETGIVEWPVSLHSGDTREFSLSYSVKYLKGLNVRLE